MDKNGYNSWDNICMGTDYDGIINPINGFRPEDQMPLFAELLLQHITDYRKADTLQSQNKIAPEEILEKIMIRNAMNFLKEIS